MTQTTLNNKTLAITLHKGTINYVKDKYNIIRFLY